jgi:hypothetical protein
VHDQICWLFHTTGTEAADGIFASEYARSSDPHLLIFDRCSFLECYLLLVQLSIFEHDLDVVHVLQCLALCQPPWQYLQTVLHVLGMSLIVVQCPNKHQPLRCEKV